MQTHVDNVRPSPAAPDGESDRALVSGHGGARSHKIIHVGMVAFYRPWAARRPGVARRPVAVGGRQRGVVMAAATRRARSACALPCPRSPPSGCARAGIREAALRVYKECRARSANLPRLHAAGRTAVARRGLSRRHQPQRTSRSSEIARRKSARILEKTGLTASASISQQSSWPSSRRTIASRTTRP